MTNMREVEFQKASYSDWKEATEKALKGKPFESLLTKTIEGITLEPLYTEESLLEKVDGKLEEQVSTIRSLKEEGAFGVAQEAFGETIEAFIAQVEESFERGNEFVTVGKVAFEWTEEALQQLATLLSKHKFRLNVHDEAILSVFNYIENKQIEGYVQSAKPVELLQFPNVRTINAYTLSAHYAGATNIQELAIALAQAAQLIGNEEFEKFEQKFFASFAIDTQFFMEIAKLRAFRILWKAFAKGYGVDKPAPVKVLTENSLRTFTKLDVYVNLLRAGNEAFSAVIGGADVLTVHPHNILTGPTNQSVRIARNAALVIKEESHVTKVLDPSGGSYFIESLTHDLVKNAWAYFLEIQQAGGYAAVVASGKLAQDLDEKWQERLQNVKRRKTVLVGTNNYADATEQVPAENFVTVNRLAQPFEDLRKEYQEQPIKAAILTFGELKKTKPRTDFVQGVFATAGITPEITQPTTDIAQAKQWLQQTDAQYVVLSATDEDAIAILPQLLEVKSEAIILDAAGKLDESFKQQGLHGFVHVGINIYELLHGIHVSMKEVLR